MEVRSLGKERSGHEPRRSGRERAQALGEDWPIWWRGVSLRSKMLPLVLILAYGGALRLLGGLRGDHINLGMAMLAFAYGGRLAAPIGNFLFPVS